MDDAAIAREGFEILHTKMAACIGAAHGMADRLYAGTEAYVVFALDHPAHFRVMFRPDVVDMTRFPEAKCSSVLALSHLRGLVHELRGTSAAAATPEDDVWTSLLWSTAHGLACLLLDGPLTMMVPCIDRTAHIREVLHALTALVVPPSGSGPDKPRRPGPKPRGDTSRGRPATRTRRMN